MPLTLRVLVQNPLCSGLREPPGPVIFIMPANSLLDGKDTPPALDRHEAEVCQALSSHATSSHCALALLTLCHIILGNAQASAASAAIIWSADSAFKSLLLSFPV
jgi:hypothetical protein